MKKNIKVVIKILLILFIIANISTSRIYAANSTLGGIVSGAQDFLNEGKNATSPINTDQLQTGSSTLFNVLFFIGIAIALIWGIVLGIKFMTDSVEEQAKIKENLVPYIFGCVIIFGALGIWKVVLTILQPIS